MSFPWGRPSPDERVRIARQMVAYWQYCEAFVERRAGKLTDDLTSDLLRTAGETPGTLSHVEIASIVYGLSFAGHETTTNLISNSIRQLLEHPHAWAALCAEPRRIPGAVEEILRFDSSVIAWRRVTTRPTTIGDAELPAGAKLLLLLCAANHDPARFPEATSLIRQGYPFLSRRRTRTDGRRDRPAIARSGTRACSSPRISRSSFIQTFRFAARSNSGSRASIDRRPS